MDIQDVTYDSGYRHPILQPNQFNTQETQDSSKIRSIERSVEIDLTETDNDSPNTKPSLQSIDLFNPLGIQNSSGDTFQIEDLRQGFEAKSAELSARLQQFFSSHGIRAPVAADMSVDAQGRVVVSGDPAYQAALQAEFDGDSELGANFRALSAAGSLLRAADAAVDFAQAYDLNPEAALNQFAHLFSDKFKFNYHHDGDKLSADFRSANGNTIEWWQEAAA